MATKIALYRTVQRKLDFKFLLHSWLIAYPIRDILCHAVDSTSLPSMRYDHTIFVGGSDSLVGYSTKFFSPLADR